MATGRNRVARPFVGSAIFRALFRYLTIPAVGFGLAVIVTLAAPVNHVPTLSSFDASTPARVLWPVHEERREMRPSSYDDLPAKAEELSSLNERYAPDGPARWGEAGDLILHNQRISLTIARAGRGRGLFPTGGQLIDADVVRRPGEAGADRFREMSPTVDLRFGLAFRSSILADGSRGAAIGFGAGPLLRAALIGISSGRLGS